MSNQQVSPPTTPYGLPIPLAVAMAIAEAAQAEATKINVAVAIAIVDSGGNLVLSIRLDNTQISGPRIAEHKARTAVEFRRSTKVFEEAVGGGGIGLRVLTFGICVAEGGIPVVQDGKVVGAIGVSGATSHQDAQIAQAGLSALERRK